MAQKLETRCDGKTFVLFKIQSKKPLFYQNSLYIKPLFSKEHASGPVNSTLRFLHDILNIDSADFQIDLFSKIDDKRENIAFDIVFNFLFYMIYIFNLFNLLEFLVI